MDSAVETISFSRDDKWLVVTYVASALITVINIPSRTLTIKFNAETEVNCAFISPSGRSIVVAYRNILIYSRENGDLVRQIKSFG